MDWLEPFTNWIGELGAYSSLFVLVAASTLVVVSMIVNHLLTDVKQLGEYGVEIKRYASDLNEARKINDREALRKLKKRESEIRELQSTVSRQRMKVTLVTMVPFLAIYSLLSTAFRSVSIVAIIPFAFPLIGRNLSFYLWYLICYFTAYLPLSRVFKMSVDDEPRQKPPEKPDKRSGDFKRNR